MAAHDAWALVCRLFAGGTPVLRATLSLREAAALTVLGKAVKPTVVDQSFVLCPHCQQHRAQVWGDGRGGRMCRCPDCGPVAVEANDGAALALDEDWLRQKLRLALDIESRDGIDDLGGGVWRLGDARRSPVLLARDLTRVLHEPALLDRVRVAGGEIRVITPRPSTTRGSPFGAGVEWLVLEERFTFYGGGITFIASPSSATPVVVDLATPVNGPFSADFKWATLPDISSVPKCSRRCGRSRAKPRRRSESCTARAWEATSRLTSSRSRRRTRANRSLRRSTRPTVHSWSRRSAQACMRCRARQRERRSPCRDLTTRCAKARADFKSLTFSIFWSA